MYGLNGKHGLEKDVNIRDYMNIKQKQMEGDEMMSLQSENTRRIAKNIVYLYGRMLFGMLVSLYTSRVILSVVGSFVAMSSLISGALSSAIGRFITF